MIIVNKLKIVFEVKGQLPFSKNHNHLHLFLESSFVHVHLVVFHQIQKFVWIGQIPKTILESLGNFTVHYGLNEEIYDPFSVDKENLLNFPTDIFHYLSQISTSRYIHCPIRRTNWFLKNNIKMDDNKIISSKVAILSTKSLMKDLKMQFWIACGTLLGKENKFLNVLLKCL